MNIEQVFKDFEEEIKEDDKQRELQIKAEKDCPFDEPLHYHHDGCPACDYEPIEGFDMYGDTVKYVRTIRREQ